MSAMVETLLQSTPWASLPCATGPATDVPFAFRRLLMAQSAADADVAYWQLDNVVILQGRIFPSALPLIALIGLALVECAVTTPARYRLVELMTEFALGQPHESVVDADAMSVAIAVEVHRQAGVVCSLLADEDPRVRRDAIEILFRAEGEVDR
jgi:hypothetical protein